MLNDSQKEALAKYNAIQALIAGGAPGSGIIGERDMAWQDCREHGITIMADGSIQIDKA